MTLAEEKAALVAELVGAAIERVTKVHNGEPLRVDGPHAIAVSTAGVNPSAWLLRVRLYTRLSDSVERRQVEHDEILGALEAALIAAPRYGEATFETDTVTLLPEVQGATHLMSTAVIPVGREDF